MCMAGMIFLLHQNDDYKLMKRKAGGMHVQRSCAIRKDAKYRGPKEEQLQESKLLWKEERLHGFLSLHGLLGPEAKLYKFAELNGLSWRIHQAWQMERRKELGDLVIPLTSESTNPVILISARNAFSCYSQKT